MKKQKLLPIVNIIIFVLFLNQILTGYFRASLPSGWFPILHENGAALFLVAVILHIYLNFGWVKAQFKKKH